MSLPLKFPCVIGLFAAPMSGKSHMIRHLMHSLTAGRVAQGEKPFFNFGIAITQTGKWNGDYDFLPQDCIHDSCTAELIEEFIKLCEKNKKKGKQAFIIFDDCLGICNFANPVYVKLFSVFRHYNITVLLATQYVYKISPTIRECLSYAMLFRQETKKSVKALYETYGQSFDMEREFKDYLNSQTLDKNILLFTRGEQDITRKFRQYRAPPTKRKFLLKF